MIDQFPYSEEALKDAGLEPDTAWDLSRSFSVDDVLNIPESYLPTAESIAILFELTGQNTDKILDFIVRLGEAVIKSEIENAENPIPSLSLHAGRVGLASFVTALHFDEDFEREARTKSSVTGAPIDVHKRTLYRECGISAAILSPVDMPTTRERYVRRLTTTAFIEGFPPDFDLTPTMKLIEEQPMLVNGVVNLGLRGQSLRIYCSLIQQGGLDRESIHKAHPDLTEGELFSIWNASELYIAFVALMYEKSQDLDEESKIASTEEILKKFVYKLAKHPKVYLEEVTSELIGEYFTEDEVLSIFMQPHDRQDPATYSIQKICRRYKIQLPITIIKDGKVISTVTEDTILHTVTSEQF